MADWRAFNYKEWEKLDKEFDHVSWEKCFETCTAKDSLDDWLNEYEKALKAAMKECGGRPPWKPNAFYNEGGDMLEVYFNDEQSYAHWLNPQITLMLSLDTKEIVGVKIYGISKMKSLIKKMTEPEE